MDLTAHICIGMFLDMQSWCLSSVTAFCVRVRSFQEGQVEVSPKSLIAEQVCDWVLDFWAQDWQGLGTVSHAGYGQCWRYCSGSLLWSMHRIGEWKLFLPLGVLGKACVYVCTCMWRAAWECWGGKMVCKMMSAGLGPTLCSCTVLCGQSQTSSDECVAQLLYQSLPIQKCFPLICSSAVTETNASVPLLSPQWARRVSPGAAVLLCPWPAQTLQWIYSPGFGSWTPVPSSPLPAQVSLPSAQTDLLVFVQLLLLSRTWTRGSLWALVLVHVMNSLSAS